MQEKSLKHVEIGGLITTITSYSSDPSAEKLTKSEIIATVLVQVMLSVCLYYGFVWLLPHPWVPHCLNMGGFTICMCV